MKLRGRIDLAFIHREEARAGAEAVSDVLKRMQRRVDMFLDARQLEADRLGAALRLYRHCRHGSPDCFCTKEARAAIDGGELPTHPEGA